MREYEETHRCNHLSPSLCNPLSFAEASWIQKPLRERNSLMEIYLALLPPFGQLLTSILHSVQCNRHCILSAIYKSCISTQSCLTFLSLRAGVECSQLRNISWTTTKAEPTRCEFVNIRRLSPSVHGLLQATVNLKLYILYLDLYFLYLYLYFYLYLHLFVWYCICQKPNQAIC